jgi:hypothetical protein
MGSLRPKAANWPAIVLMENERSVGICKAYSCLRVLDVVKRFQSNA